MDVLYEIGYEGDGYSSLLMLNVFYTYMIAGVIEILKEYESTAVGCNCAYNNASP